MEFEPLASSHRPLSCTSSAAALRSRAAVARGFAIERSVVSANAASSAADMASFREFFRATGGIANSAEMVNLLRQHCDQPISVLARWIVAREVVNFACRFETVVPLFQFDMAEGALRPEVRAVIAELADACDDQDLARWFALPSAWLCGERPVAVLRHDPAAVLHAARADRFAALG